MAGYKDDLIKKLDKLSRFGVISYHDGELIREAIEYIKELYNEAVYKNAWEVMRKKWDKDWIEVDDALPEPEEMVLLSFSNFPDPITGHYRIEEDGGGVFHLGDEGSCLEAGLFVNAWMPLPKCMED